MERTYTPTEMANIIQQFEATKARHREAQRTYYSTHSLERRAYASQYYQANKERILARINAKNNQPQMA